MLRKGHDTCGCRYFEESSSEEEGGPEGEGEEAVRERIAREFHWSESHHQSGGRGEEEEDDPLDAFMAGIEVSVSLTLTRTSGTGVSATDRDC